ncbi:MAG TPA: hypothetical protein VGI92_01935 [Gemmatimonadales bacterium]|jgi:hypothetical protein
MMNRLVERMRRLWDEFWFEPASPLNLTWVRSLVALHALWMMFSRNYAAVSGLPIFWISIPSGLRWRYLLFPGHPVFEQSLQTIAIIALVCVALGVLPRVACVVASLLVYHLAPLETFIWTPTPFARGLTLTPLILVVLACAPGAGGYQLWPRSPASDHEPSWRYGWPLRLTWLFVAQIYLFAAFAKAEASGWRWSSAESIRRWLLVFALDPRWRFHSLAFWLAAHPTLCLIIGIVTVVLEWSVVLAVFSKIARAILLPVLLAFAVGIMLILSIHVGETWLVLTFLDVDRLAQRLRAWKRPGGASGHQCGLNSFGGAGRRCGVQHVTGNVLDESEQIEGQLCGPARCQ